MCEGCPFLMGAICLEALGAFNVKGAHTRFCNLAGQVVHPDCPLTNTHPSYLGGPLLLE